jgi:hypothetical protein
MTRGQGSRKRRPAKPKKRPTSRAAKKKEKEPLPVRAAASPQEHAINELQRLLSYVRSDGWERRILERCFTDEERRAFGSERTGREQQQQGADTPRVPIDLWYAQRRKISHVRAIVELACGMGSANPASYNWILEAIGEEVPVDSLSRRLVWDRHLRELRLDGRVVRRIRGLRVAKNVVAILDAFENSSWQDYHVTNPLGPDRDDQTLREAVVTLNEGLRTKDLWFESDGTGNGVIVRFKGFGNVRPTRKNRRKSKSREAPHSSR